MRRNPEIEEYEQQAVQELEAAITKLCVSVGLDRNTGSKRAYGSFRAMFCSGPGSTPRKVHYTLQIEVFSPESLGPIPLSNNPREGGGAGGEDQGSGHVHGPQRMARLAAPIEY